MLQVPVSRQVSRYLNSFVTRGQLGMGDVSRTATLHNLKKVKDCSWDAMNTESTQRLERAYRYTEHHTRNPQVTFCLRVHLIHDWICRSAITAATAINPLSVDMDVSDTCVCGNGHSLSNLLNRLGWAYKVHYHGRPCVALVICE